MKIDIHHLFIVAQAVENLKKRCQNRDCLFTAAHAVENCQVGCVFSKIFTAAHAVENC